MLTVRVPATIANMGPGFDSFGMAVTLYNQFTFAVAERDSLHFSAQSQADTQELAQATQQSPSDAIMLVAMSRLYAKAGKSRPPVRVDIQTDIPVTRGLGSSSTAIVAGLMAANHWLQKPFSQQDLLDIAIEMEGHPDNVAPALLGGIVLYDTKPYGLPWPQEWRIMTLSPDYMVLTEEARRILPQTVSLQDSIFNLRKASVLTYALLMSDADALREGLHDRLHQPYRRSLIKEYSVVEQLALDNGAFGVIISGSGSTIAILYPTVLHASFQEKLVSAIHENGWAITLHDLSVDTTGAQILDA